MIRDDPEYDNLILNRLIVKRTAITEVGQINDLIFAV